MTFNDMVQNVRKGGYTVDQMIGFGNHPGTLRNAYKSLYDIVDEVMSKLPQDLTGDGILDQASNVVYSLDYPDDILDSVYEMVEDKIIEAKKKREEAIMDEVYELEYNDFVKFEGYGTYYVKSTNENDSYNGCMIWAGPDKDDDRGWYFYASDFGGVVERSNSGERLFW